MVVRLKADQFTAGDMVIAVRSRRKARADPKFYGEKVAEIQIENKKKEDKRVEEEATTKASAFKDSDEYFESAEPQIVEEQQEEEQQDQEQQEQQPQETTLESYTGSSDSNERALKLLREIEEDVRQMRNISLPQEPLKRIVNNPKYSSRNATPSTMTPLESSAVQDVVNNRYRQKPIMPTSDEPYKSIIGENIPVKRTGQFVNKKTGLFVPETRGKPKSL